MNVGDSEIVVSIMQNEGWRYTDDPREADVILINTCSIRDNAEQPGCFRMNMNEIATAAREKLPLIEVIVNNHVLGMVRQWQDLFYEKRYSATVLDDGVDFVKLAEAMGAKGYRVTSQEEFKEAFKEALESEVPVLIDCIINCDDKVWPMVAPGEAISSSFTGEDLAKKQQS